MGRECCRILRIASEEAVTMNSREKAPFLLLVEARTLAFRFRPLDSSFLCTKCL